MFFVAEMRHVLHIFDPLMPNPDVRDNTVADQDDFDLIAAKIIMTFFMCTDLLMRQRLKGHTGNSL